MKGKGVELRLERRYAGPISAVGFMPCLSLDSVIQQVGRHLIISRREWQDLICSQMVSLAVNGGRKQGDQLRGVFKDIGR